MSTLSDAGKELQTLLKALNDPKIAPSLSLEQLQLLGQSLVAEPTSKGLAILCLSLYAQKVHSTSISDKDASKAIVDATRPYVQQVFAPSANDPTAPDDPETCVPFTLLLGNLFPFAPVACVSLLNQPITTDQGSALNPLGVLLEVAELPCPLQPALAEMLGQAAGSKQGRQMVRDRAMDWLQGAVNLQDEEGGLGVLCAVALSKLGPEPQLDGVPPASGTPQEEQIKMDAALANKMIQHIISHRNAPSRCGAAVEGLGVLSTKSYIKELICRTPKALNSILVLSPVLGPRPSSLPQTPRGSMDFNEKALAPVETALCYGLTVIFVNLTSRRPQLSAEDEQVERLRRMAISGKKGGGDLEEDPMESDEAVAGRVMVVIAAGVVSALSGLVRADSRGVKEALGRLCLSLVEDKANRPLFIRDGGVRVLSTIIRDLMTPPKLGQNSVPASAVSQPSNGTEGLSAAQALAKLIITTPPHLLFPPPHLTTALNALSPMYLLLTHPTSTLLQTFEALMALTNLASIDPSIATRILQATITPPRDEEIFRGLGREDTTHVITKVEELLLADNTLVRRAATELVCNLVGSSAGIAYYSGISDQASANSNTARARSRLNVLLILTNVEDLPTQLAAGGALAGLTESEGLCRLLLDDEEDERANKRNIWNRVMGMLEPEVSNGVDDENGIPLISSTPTDVGLVLRAVIILLNLLSYLAANEADLREARLGKAKEAGVERKLREIIAGGQGDEVVPPAQEALKILKQGS